MVKPGAKKSPRPASAGKGSGGKGSGGKSPRPGQGPLNTAKGQFTFTMVTDGCYIEHKWGQNSGHVGVPLEAIPNFIARLQACYQKATGQSPASKSPKAPGSGPKGAIDKKKDGKSKKAEKKEKKEPRKEAPKKSIEDLDAELMSYTAARAADGEGEPVAVEE